MNSDREPQAPAQANASKPWLGSIVLAACALPGVMSGVMPSAAHAEEAPEQGLIAFKYSHYQDFQFGSSGSSSSESDSARRTVQSAKAYNDVSRASGGGGSGGGTGSGSSGGESSTVDRMSVSSPSLYLMLPLGRQWSVEGSVTLDDVSGASPAYYTDTAGFGHMTDTRKAADLKLTRYFERQTLSLGTSHSTEHDYVSNAVSLDGTWATEDHNTTWNAGIGLTRDKINPTTKVVVNEHKSVNELQVGVTQAWTSRDLVQGMFTLSRGSGYFNDPYKYQDERPRERNATIALLRWNHALGKGVSSDGALKSSYRYYTDSYGIHAHTVELAWAKPFTASTTLTPSVRYYMQSAANFYADPSSDSSVYPGPSGNPSYFTADQRMAAWGSVALGLKQETQIDANWSFDAKFEGFAQDTHWRLGGGSPGLERLYGVQWQIGLARKF